MVLGLLPLVGVCLSTYLLLQQAQTPQQRRANAKFAKQEEQKRGKPFAETSKKEVQKASISGLWIGMSLAVKESQGRVETNTCTQHYLHSQSAAVSSSSSLDCSSRSGPLPRRLMDLLREQLR